MTEYSRRHFLAKSAGTAAALILPQFHSLARAQTGVNGIPKRMVCMSMGYGVSIGGWFPREKNTTSEWETPELLKPMERHKKDISIVQNLSLQGKANRSSPAHYSGLHLLNDATLVNPKSSHQKSIATCDQIAADFIGKDTLFPSLALAATDSDKLKGGNGPGMRSISWNTQGRHIPGIQGALKLYVTLYGNADSVTGKRPDKNVLANQFSQKKSIMDFLVRDIKSLNSKLSKEDQQVLDQYTSSLREVEINLGRAFDLSSEKGALQHIDRPPEELDGVSEIKLTYDLMALAMEADYTRIITYMLSVDPILKSIGAKAGSHDMSHYRSETGKAAHRARDLINMEMLSYFFDKLKAVKQPDGQTLFDHSMISFCSGLRHRHSRSNIPMLFAGGGGGGIKQGQNVMNKKDTPINDFWFSQLHQINPQLKEYNLSKNTISDIFKT